MSTKTIPLSQLELNLAGTLNECARTGETVVVLMPDKKMLTIQSLDPVEDDGLIDELLASDPLFRQMVAESAAGKRYPFPSGTSGMGER
jgi:hypothetical protein